MARLTDEFKALQIFFLGVLTGLPPELIIAVVKSYWQNGLPTQTDLAKSQPSLSEDEVLELHQVLGMLHEFLRGLDRLSKDTLVVNVPGGVLLLACEYCGHQFEATAEQLSDLEAAMSVSGCPHCGHLHSRGRWFEE